MGERKKTEYMDSLWESGDDNMLRLFFGRKLYFLNQINIELMKLSHPDIYDDENNILFQVDHIIPMNAGGKSTLDNLQILCRQCNGQKGDKS
ncbi:MAG: HNH endonuclease signature motif containing protein [Blautia sp.]|nr:HNH endonuclease signature motif containing protein [Blautia sp.]